MNLSDIALGTHESSSGFIATEFHPCVRGSTLSVNPRGSLGLLSSDNMILVLDLDNPGKPKAKVDRKSRYSIKETQFSFGKEALCALAINDRIEMYDFETCSPIVQEQTLEAHSRIITDLSWHEQETDLLASSSIERQTIVWDIRAPLVPALYLESSTNASQVCWERISGNNLATSHDGEIRVWDKRKPSGCVKYITAHKDKISAMDFSSNRKGYLVSTGKDLDVRFWNIDQSQKHISPEREFHSPNPVWKMRFTPFGDGLVTLVTNSLLRAETNLMLWNAHELGAPVHTFFGHSEMVKEFCWRNEDIGRERDDLQLVSWGDDLTLRFWHVGKNLKMKCDNFIDQFPNEEEQIEEEEEEEEKPEESVEVKKEQEECESQEDPNTNTSSVSPPSECVEITEEPPRSSSLPTVVESASEQSENLDESLQAQEESEEDSSEREMLTTGQSEEDLDPSSDLSQLGAVALPENVLTKSTSFSTAPDSISHADNPGLFACSMPNDFPPFLQERLQTEPTSLEQEFRLVNLSSTLVLEQRNVKDRTCVISGKSSKFVIYLHLLFPPDYPAKSPPKITILKNTTFGKEEQELIKSRLMRIANQVVSRGHACVDICLRQLEVVLYNISMKEEEKANDEHTEEVEPLKDVLGAKKDDNIPYPRTSGARFCGVGKLIVFSVQSRKLQNSKIDPKTGVVSTATPKSLSVFSAQIASESLKQNHFFSQSPSLKQQIFRKSSQNRINSISSTTSEDPKDFSKDRKCPSTIEDEDYINVWIYDCHTLLPLSKVLAKKYLHMGDSVTQLCMKNAALAYRFSDQAFIVETWSLLSVAAMNENSDHNEEHLMPWYEFPLNRDLLASRIEQHWVCHDIQTIAVIAAVLSSRQKKIFNYFSSDVDHKRVEDANLDSFPTNQSLEFIDTGRDVAMEAEQNFDCFNDGEGGFEPPNEANGLLSEVNKVKCEFVKRRYVSLLQRIGLWMKAAEVNKLLEFEMESEQKMDIKLSTTCSRCSTEEVEEKDSSKNTFSSFCRVCHVKNEGRICVICNVRCSKGLISICVDCGHGGHLSHVQHWFSRKKSCPDVNCSCPCPNNLPLL